MEKCATTFCNSSLFFFFLSFFLQNLTKLSEQHKICLWQALIFFCYSRPQNPRGIRVLWPLRSTLCRLEHRDVVSKNRWHTGGALCQNHQSFLWESVWKKEKKKTTQCYCTANGITAEWYNSMSDRLGGRKKKKRLLRAFVHFVQETGEVWKRIAGGLIRTKRNSLDVKWQRNMQKFSWPNFWWLEATYPHQSCNS